MYSTCLHCTRDLGRNEIVETLPIGRRLAFDAAQGRLWVVCGGCGKWNLVPFETRLESIEACERLYRDTKERYSTGTIGLARAREGLELVRIGPALLPEFASWRYGELYRRRRRRMLFATGMASVGMVTLGTASLVVQRMAPEFTLMTSLLAQGGAAFYALRGGPANLRATVRDPATGERVRLGPFSFTRAAIRRREEGLDLVVPLEVTTSRKLIFRGWEADRLVHRLLGGINTSSGLEKELAEATARVATAARSEGRSLLERIDAHHRSTTWGGKSIAEMGPDARLAWEMLGNEEVERHWLGGELAMLEREWREAEKLARIADDLAMSHEP